jgi:Fe-S-cluster containining protein
MGKKTLSFDELVDTVEELYADIDKKFGAHIQGKMPDGESISCHACTEPACCYQKVVVSIMETFPIARHIKLAKRDTDHLRELLRIRGEAMEGSPTAAWLDGYTPCVFLDENRKCSIYPVRPTRCRTYYVISPAEMCRPPSEKTVRFINDLPAIDAVLKRSLEFHQKIGLIENQMRLLRGVLPRVLLITLESWDSDDYRNTIKRKPWPSVRTIKEGWFDGNNPFGPRAKDPPQPV